MRVLVTGVKGQLGFDVVDELQRRGHTAIGVDIEEMDITNRIQVEYFLENSKPEAVVHCAAYTAVDAAEDNPELCRKINAEGTENIARMCKQLDIPMMYLSTDYVFAGEGENFWKPEDEKKPLNIYGETKYEGELAVQKCLDAYFIIRISWVFGLNGKNFIKTMLNLGKSGRDLTVVDDQIGSPTYTKDLAVLMVDMLETDKYGVYHATNEGICSWYEFACEIFRQAGLEVKVSPVSSEHYQAKAKRPHNSRMDKSKLDTMGFARLPEWQDALKRYLQELETEQEN